MNALLHWFIPAMLGMPSFRALRQRVSGSRLCRLIQMAGVLVLFLAPPMSSSLGASSDPVCAFSSDELVSRFLQAVDVVSDDDPAYSHVARWKKQSLVIGIFQDRSAAPPADPFERNLAILRGVAAVDLTIRFSMNYGGSPNDIELVFVDRATKLKVLQARPIGMIRSANTDGCPAYLEIADDGKNVRTISKAHVLIADDVDIATLPACLETGLINSVGLIGWSPKSHEGVSDDAAYALFDPFTSVLLSLRSDKDLAEVRLKIGELRSRHCH